MAKFAVAMMCVYVHGAAMLHEMGGKEGRMVECGRVKSEYSALLNASLKGFPCHSCIIQQ